MLKSSLLYKIINGIWDMCFIWKTEMRNVFRDEGVLIFCILVPLGYPLLYSWIYNNEVVREVDTAIVDLSHSHTSREFIREYDATPDAKATYYCNSLDEAKQLVQKQAVHGILYIPSDFDTRLNRGEQAHVSVYTDMSLMLTYKAIYQSALAVASHINSGIQITQAGGFTDRDDEITTEPLAFDEVPIFNTTMGYGNAILPAVLVLILQQTMLLGIGMAAGTSRELNRNRELIPVSKHYGNVSDIGGAQVVWLCQHGDMDHHSRFPLALHLVLRLLRSDAFVLGKIPRECDALSSIHLSTLALYDRCFMALEQYALLLAGLLLGIPIHIRHQGISQNQQHGRIACRYSPRVPCSLDTDSCLFLCHLLGIPPAVALSQTQGPSYCRSDRRRG